LAQNRPHLKPTNRHPSASTEWRKNKPAPTNGKNATGRITKPTPKGRQNEATYANLEDVYKTQFQEGYKKGQADLIEKLTSKDINKIASIVFWDNMKSEVENYDAIMALAIKAAIKAAATTAIKQRASLFATEEAKEVKQ